MKKGFLVCLSVLLLTSFASAAEWKDFIYTNSEGIRVVDVDSYNAAVAQELVDASGVDLEVSQFWYFDDEGYPRFANDAFESAYAAALVQLKEGVIKNDTPAEDPVDDLVDDSGLDDDLSDSVEDDFDDTGNIPLPEDNSVISDPASALDSDLTTSVPDSLPSGDDFPIFVTEDLEPHVYVVSDQRSTDYYSLALVDGLKGLMRSVFGEYTPVMTTIAITETVDGVTTTTLIDAVAEGAAGVDWEYLSGVALFGILVFCLFKLLGGVLK